MRILALDLGKYKTVACDYEAETGRHQFATVLTTPKGLHDLIVDREPDRVVIEICSIAGWVCDLVRTLGIEIQVASTNDERWQWRKVKTKNDRRDGLKLAQLSARNELDLVCAAQRNAAMAGPDCLSASPGAAAHENQKPYSRAVAARRTTPAAASQRLDTRWIGGPGGDGQTFGRGVDG